MMWRISLIHFFELESSSSLERMCFHKLVLIRPSKVRHSSIVVMTEITAGGTHVPYIVGFLLIISIQLSGDHRTFSSHISEVECVGRNIKMLPIPKNILSHWVKVVIRVLVAIVIIVMVGKWLITCCLRPSGPCLNWSVYSVPNSVFSSKSVHVVKHLVVKVRVVRTRRRCHNRPGVIRVADLSWHWQGSLSERCRWATSTDGIWILVEIIDRYRRGSSVTIWYRFWHMTRYRRRS